MSASAVHTPPSPTKAPSRARLHRAAGWGGIGAFAAWLGQPIIVALSAAGSEAEYPDYAAWVGDRAYFGGIGAAIFTGIGVGLLFLVLGTWGLIRDAGHGESASSRVGLAMGIVGASAWLLAAGATFAPFTSVGSGLPEVAPDSAQQAALIEVLNIAMTGTLMTFALAMTGWAVMMATTGRRAGVIGLPLTIVAVIGVAVAVVTFALPFQPPWGSIGLLLFALILGIALLVRARRA